MLLFQAFYVPPFAKFAKDGTPGNNLPLRNVALGL
jgi:hypothetical protein